MPMALECALLELIQHPAPSLRHACPAQLESIVCQIRLLCQALALSDHFPMKDTAHPQHALRAPQEVSAMVFC